MHNVSNDIICAVATPPGTGGIATVRVSGPGAPALVDRIWCGSPLADTPANTARVGEILTPPTAPDSAPEVLDQAVATVFRAPRSFTGEDTVEISVHGSRYIQQQLLKLLCANGARLAEPGEFTRRAFTNGKIDLAQAEAVADIIAANSRAAHRLAATQLKGDFSRRLDRLRDRLVELASLLELELDFSEEEVEFASHSALTTLAREIRDETSRLYASFNAGNAIKEGIPVAIIGPTNAGKSSLLNRLLGEDRAIVSDIHGTTRDTIEETLAIGDYTFRLIDTAGLRNTCDPIETLGIERSRRAADRAAIILHVVDLTAPDTPPLPEPAANAPAEIILLNKTDLCPDLPRQWADRLTGTPTDIIPISTLTGEGIDTLLDRLRHIADSRIAGATEDTLMVTNARHAQALREATDSLDQLLRGLSTDLPGDLLAQHLRAAIHHLSTITGTITTSDLLHTIFSRFCIGK